MFAPEGRRDAGRPLVNTRGRFVWRKWQKSMCGAFSFIFREIEVSLKLKVTNENLLLYKKSWPLFLDLKTRVEKLGTEAGSFTGKQ